MTTWTLKTQHKKSAVEKQHWYKDGKEIVRTEGYRWGTFYCESDEQPEIDLVNPDGYEIGSDDYDWELESLDDGCWAEWDWPEDMTEEQQDAIVYTWKLMMSVSGTRSFVKPMHYMEKIGADNRV